MPQRPLEDDDPESAAPDSSEDEERLEADPHLFGVESSRPLSRMATALLRLPGFAEDLFSVKGSSHFPPLPLGAVRAGSRAGLGAGAGAEARRAPPAGRLSNGSSQASSSVPRRPTAPRVFRAAGALALRRT